MKTLTINKNSWHYRLINFINYDSHFEYKVKNNSMSICEYNSYLIGSVFRVFVGLLFTIFVTYIIISPLSYFWDYKYFTKDIVILGKVIDILISLFILIFWSIEYKYVILSNIQHKITESYIVQALRAFKDKICINVDFK